MRGRTIEGELFDLISNNTYIKWGILTMFRRAG